MTLDPLRRVLDTDPSDPDGIAPRLLDYLDGMGALDTDFAVRVHTSAAFRAYPLADAGFDSLDLVELVMWAEAVFFVDLPTPGEPWATLGDVLDAIVAARD